MIPSHWNKATLGDEVEILDSKRVPVNAKERANRVGAVPYYGATGEVGWIDDALFNEELVLLGEDGAPFFDRTRDVAYRIHGPAWVNNHAHVLRAGRRMTNRFLLHQLNQVDYRPFVSGTTRAKLPQGPMKEIPLVVPPLEEQDRIVAAIETHFSRLDAAVASLTRAKANVKRARASVLKAAVEGRLVPTEAALARAEGRDYEPAAVLLDRILAERKAAWAASGARGKYKEPVKPETEGVPGLPEGWCWASVDDLAGDGGKGLCDGPFGSNLKSAHYVDSGPRVVRLQNIGDGAFRDERAHITDEHFESLRKHKIKGGDLVIASLGETLPRACIIPEWLGSAIVKADCIRFSTTARVSVAYLNAALNSPPVRKRTTDKIHGIGRPRLGLGGIREIAIPLPPLAEQHRIVAEVDRRLSVLDALDATLDANLARCDRLRQAVLKRAFEGRLVPAEADAPLLAAEPQMPLFSGVP
ncbi:MAG: restriction endonuclease subunit S [Alphaproteobacteria bacterium]|nr:restriction endonuclease subunit S [Alphaproteobacteria bacterium]